MATEWPQPVIRRRKPDPNLYVEALASGLHPVAARVLAARGIAEAELEAVLRPSLSNLDHYSGLPDIGRAAARIAEAVVRGEVIGIETDYDADGAASHAVIVGALTGHFGHPRDRVQGFVGHRLTEGYGLSGPVVERILKADPRPTLVITADNGSSDEPRIARLRAAGIDVIVTDHHGLPAEGPPRSAYACVSPQREDSAYPDRAIAGCMVAWLLMCAVRARLIEMGRLGHGAPHLADLLDYVAVGTVADCVTLASPNNRAVVRAGLARINAGVRPCWRAVRRHLWTQGPLSAEDLAFGIGPRLNARGRLNEAMLGVNFLLSDSDPVAEVFAEILEEENHRRKSIERAMRDRAAAIAAEQVARGRCGLVVWLPDGHPGVVGIVASRLVEAFGRPAVCLAPRQGDEGLVTGSVRGVEGFHVRDALEACVGMDRGLLEAFGGHAAAGGLTLRRERLRAFEAAFAAVAAVRLEGRALGPVLETDGPLAGDEMTLETVEALEALAPWGRGFEPPLFDGRFVVCDARPVGDGTHLRLALEAEGRRIGGIWFRAGRTLGPGSQIDAVYELSASEFRGERRVEVIIRHAVPATVAA